MEYIYRKYLSNSVTPLEEKEFMDWVRLPENESVAKDLILMGIHENSLDVSFDAMEAKSMIQAIILSDKTLVDSTADLKPVPNNQLPAASYSPVSPPQVVHRVRFLKTAWFRWSAAIILLFCLFTYVYLITRKQDDLIAANKRVRPENEVMPGKNGAIVTLADGSKVLLDDLGSGEVATQNGSRVTLNNGQLAYSASGKPGSELAYNTMTTPRGRQFCLMLPDGTKVWLNAASSVKYPVAFGRTSREIEMTGEAYFEIVKDKNKPFRVLLNNKAAIEVLGTGFNVNSYEDEAIVNTTLLEGSIRILTQGPDAGKKPNDSLLLKPGQQAQFLAKNTGDKLTLVENADTKSIMAWKNGYFSFKSVGIDVIMREISRWYNVDVVFEGKVPPQKLTGEIPRNVSLSSFLKALQLNNVRVKHEGRRLILMS